jgi:DNA polymerase III delta subunit
MSYCIMSDDPILRKQMLDELIEQALPVDARVFNLRTLNAERHTAFDILSQLSSWPQMGAEHVVVAVHDAQKLTTDEGKKLLAGLDDIPDSGFLILVVDTTDKFKLPDKLKSAISKAGGMYQLGGSDKQEKVEVATKYVRKLFSEAEVPLSPSITSEIVERVGPSCVALSNECRKIIDYVKAPGDVREPTSDDLDLLLIPTIEDVTFKLVDCAVSGDCKHAVEYIRNRLANTQVPPKTEVYSLTSLIYRQLILIWQAKQLISAGVSLYNTIPSDVLPVLPNKMTQDDKPCTLNLTYVLSRGSWQARKLTSQSKQVSWLWLCDAISQFRELTNRLKSSEWADEDPERMLTLEVLSMCSMAGGSYAR